MNILLLTPDGVGGTLLERTITVLAQLHNFDRPVIDVSHIELGLEKYYSNDFNSEILRSTNDSEYAKMQSLPEIRKILESVDHYKIIKLPYYNILSRQDPIEEQVPFYRYLNDNYYIICCTRMNIFEHALSWAISKVTNQLNVYSPEEKLQQFNLYKNKLEIDPLSVKQSLHSYKQFINWAESNFQIASYYQYEKHMPELEKYVLSLPFFAQENQNTWKKTFGIDFKDWNKCHYYSADIGKLALHHKKPELQQIEQILQTDSLNFKLNTDIHQLTVEQNNAWKNFLREYKNVADPSWPELNSIEDWSLLPEYVKEECLNVHEIGYHLENIILLQNKSEKKYNFNIEKTKVINQSYKNIFYHLHKKFNDNHLNSYEVANKSIKQMKNIGIMPNSMPLKKHTLSEKKFIVKNFDECLRIYNQWADKNKDIADVLFVNDVEEQIKNENYIWRDYENVTVNLQKTHTS